jgi:hypothetical protein
MTFGAILRQVGMIAGFAAHDLISVINPPLGTLIGTLLNSIVLAEARVGPGNGAQKKDVSLNAIQVAAPLLVQLIESTTQKTLVDNVLFTSGIEKLNDGIVDVLNAFRILPKA